MELSTGRLIMMVDRTVWNLYGDKMRAWADSVDLELETIVADANEDKKTLETFTYMLDELKRAAPKINRQSLRDALEGMKAYDLGGLEVSYSANDHSGLQYVDLAILDESGKFRR